MIVGEGLGPLALPGYLAALFLFVVVLVNQLDISAMESEDWWLDSLDTEKMKRHKIGFSLLKWLMVTDMELIALLPWKQEDDENSAHLANGFPLKTVRKGRFTAYFEDISQLAIQVGRGSKRRHHARALPLNCTVAHAKPS